MLRLSPSADVLPRVGTGAECNVYTWVEGWVLKVYETREEAADACRRQEESASCHLGPSTDGQGVFEVSHFEEMGWAYVSEEVKTMTWAECRTLQVEIRDLKREMRRQGISTHDMHYKNLGWLADGTLVKLDFGDMSTRQGYSSQHASSW